MYNSRQSKEYYEENRRGKTYRHKTSDHYICSTNSNIRRSDFRESCSAHFIRTAVIRELVLDTIRKVSEYVKLNESEFVEKIREASTVKQAETAKAHKKQLAANDRRIAELDRLFQRVYEDSTNGKLSDERYNQLSTAYEQEQRDLREQNIRLQSELDAFTEDSQKADNFIAIVKRYTVFDELTNPMLHEFVDKISVYEADKSTGERVQNVDIYLNFIGNFELPQEEAAPPTPEELDEQEKIRQRKAKQRAANKRWYAKKTAEHKWQQAVASGEVSQEEIDAYNEAKTEQEQTEQAHREQREAEQREYKRKWARDKRDAELAAKGGKSPRALRQDEFKLMTPEQQAEEKRKWRNEWQRNYRAKQKTEGAAKTAKVSQEAV